MGIAFFFHSKPAMPQFAANLSLMYTEYPFLERFAAARHDGFAAVEFLFPYGFAKEDIVAKLKQQGQTQVLFNLPPGNWEQGERGIAALPGREAEFQASVEQALEYALATDCRRLHVMAGLINEAADVAAMRATYVANLRYAARRVAEHGITLLIEPINTRDMPGYFLNYQQQAGDIVAEVGEPNLKVQMDWYHCQIMEGDIAGRLQQHFDTVGHIQVAGVPGRHEPDSGELNMPYLYALLDKLGYSGYIGCEYRPKAGTSAGLGWFQPWSCPPPMATATRHRLATWQDMQSIHSIYMHSAVIPFLTIDPVPIGEFATVYGDLLAGGDFYVYEVEGELAGFYRAARYSGRAHHVAYLGTLAIAPAFQGKGIARVMIEETLSSLKADGVRRVELKVEKDNPRAIALYQRLGFVAEGIAHQLYKRADEAAYVDDVQMAIWLS